MAEQPKTPDPKLIKQAEALIKEVTAMIDKGKKAQKAADDLTAKLDK